MAALQDCMANPANFLKYQGNPKVMAVFQKGKNVYVCASSP